MNIKFKTEIKLPKKDLIEERTKRVLWKSVNKVVELAKGYAPVDTGLLRNSITFYPIWPGSAEYLITDGVDYGIHVEYGTSPHSPPIGPLKLWSRRVLGDEKAAYAVRAGIAKYGTPAQPFFRPSLAQVKAYWIKAFFGQVFGQA